MKNYQGLSQKTASKRLKKFGENKLKQVRQFSAAKLFLSQFADLLIIILLIATGLSFILGETLDAIIILAIVFFSAALGFIQEFRSQKALEALKKMASPIAHVIRDNLPQKIPAEKVVPGDLIILQWGDKIPADARLVECLDLRVSEAVLTGESIAVGKKNGDLVYSGTIVARGHAKAIVTATGMQTEFGKIARLLNEVKTEPTPLEKKLAQVGRYLGIGSLIICFLAALLGIWRGHPLLEMLIWGVSLAVAAVPEALPAVVTSSLSLGVWEMAKRQAIVRHLPAVETLGSVNVICSDKTGTLTRNEMTVREIFVNHQTIFVEGKGYNPNGGFLVKKANYQFKKDKELLQVLTIGLLCNDAVLVEKGKEWLIDGDPTEGALLVAAAKAGFDQKKWQKKLPRLGEIPFEMDRKRMSTYHPAKNGGQLLVKGAPESVLSRCAKIQINGQVKKITSREIKKLLTQTNQMAEKALRVLAFAYRPVSKKEIPPDLEDLKPEQMEKDLIFVGLMGMIDPARDEAASAIKTCHKAGIKTIIITGDHALTTWAIGKEIGLFQNKKQIITSQQLKKLSEKELLKIVAKKSYARVSPEDKLRIIKALKKKGYIVAMTGDGVNDAPALKKADIGIAMGITGTDVAKESAEMILADDNFATIVSAIRKGREIYNNIKKYLFYLLRCNIGEILVLGGGFLFGLPPVLSAIQILWINLATDGLPAIALGVDPSAEEVMLRKPLNSQDSIFNKKSISLMFILAFNMAIILLPQFFFSLKRFPLIKTQSFVFATMVLMEMINAYNSRSENSIFKIKIWENKWLNLAVLSSLLLTALIIQWPVLSSLFGTVPLTFFDWLLVLVLSSSTLLFSEGAKRFL